MYSNKIWGNDERYSKEEQILFRQISQEQQKRNQEYWENHTNLYADEYEAGKKMMEKVKTRQDQGEIIDPFIKNWLTGEITAARTALVIGMLLTVLIKGQIIIWAIMYFAYKGRVKKVTEEAREADRKRFKR